MGVSGALAPEPAAQMTADREAVGGHSVYAGLRWNRYFGWAEKAEQKRLTRWLRSLRDHNHLRQVLGSLQPVKGSLRRYAPLTGFHSNEALKAL